MNISKITKSLFTAGLVSLGMISQAEVISVNFGRGNGAHAITGTAGYEPAANWNNINSDTNNSGTSTTSNLINDAGTTTTASVEYFNRFWRVEENTTSDNHKLFSSYTNTPSDANGTISVTSLPSAFRDNGYKVILYLQGPNAQRHNSAIEVGAGITGGTDDVAANQWIRYFRNGNAGTFDLNGTYATEALAQASSTNTNTIVFSGLNDSSFDISILKDPDSTDKWSRAAVMGFQIVSYTELKGDFATVPLNTKTTIDVQSNDPGSPAAISSVTQGTNGTVAINGTQVDYTPNSNFFGADSFTYTVGGKTAGVSVQVGGTAVTLGDGTNAHLVSEDGNENKPFVEATEASVGSNSDDSNTWGSGTISPVTGDDVGSTWRMSTLVKVGHIVDADNSDGISSAGGVNSIKAITLRLKQSAVGSANSVDYAPRAVLYGVDQDPSGGSGWFATAIKTGRGVTSSSTYVDGVFDQITSEWIFTIQVDSEPLTSSDTGDIFGIAVVGNQNAAANESITFAEAGSTLYVTTANVVTPAIGLEVSQSGTELVWTVEDEVSVKEYRVINAETKEVLEVVLAVDADFYSVEVPEGIEVELVVVDESGFSKSYAPQDGNVKIEVYDLEEGWNLIAITSDDADLETLKDETVGVLWGWNGSGYEVAETAKATDAVWVYSPIEKQIHVSGTKSDAKIKLNLGWNMVGPVENDYIPARADTVYSWSEVYDVIASEDKVLIGGKGYWVFSL